MSGTFWKTFSGHCVYRSSEIKIFQNLLYRWLMFSDQTHLQTLIHRYNPQKPVLSYLNPFTLAARAIPGSTCLLGLGGGAVPHYITSSIFPHEITAIEINKKIIQLASKWFMTDFITNLNVFQAEAHDYMMQCIDTYQHILIDIYTAEGFPNSCANRNFFMKCKQSLFSTGFLAINLANIAQELPLLQIIRDIFSHKTLCIPVPDTTNMILLASPSTHSLHQLMDNTVFKTLIWDSQIGYLARI